MPNPIIAVAGAGVGSAVVQAGAASKAAKAQTASAEAGVAEQRRQFDAIQKLLKPYVQGGTQGLSAQMGLMGLSGVNAQRAAIQGIQQGPEFAAMTQAGESAILQNASATGGLRGGNTQAALAQFRPQVLNSLINQQLQRYGGLASMGQASAAQQAAAGQASANNVSQLMQQQGAAQAGGALAQGQAVGNAIGGIGGLVGRFGIPEGGIPEGQSMFGRWGF